MFNLIERALIFISKLVPYHEDFVDDTKDNIEEPVEELVILNRNNLLNAVILVIRDNLTYDSSVVFKSDPISIDEVIQIRDITVTNELNSSIHIRFSIYINEYLCKKCKSFTIDYCNLFYETPLMRYENLLTLPELIINEINNWSKKIVDVELIKLGILEDEENIQMAIINDDIIQISERYKK